MPLKITPVRVSGKTLYTVGFVEKPYSRFESKSGIYIYLHREKFKDSGFRLLPLIEQVNRHLQDGEKTNHLVMNGEYSYSRTIPLDIFSEYMYLEKAIYCETNIMDKDYLILKGIDAARFARIIPVIVIFHEASHSFYLNVLYFQLNTSCQQNQEKKLSINQAYGNLVMEAVSITQEEKENAVRTNCYPFTPNYAFEPLLALFKESSYLVFGEDADFGHPHTNPSELFASTSTIMRYLHRHFFARVGQLRLGSPRLADLALDTARTVVCAWGSARLFSDEVYQRLGLPIPAEKEEVASSTRT